jgi:hypothetical protein
MDSETMVRVIAGALAVLCVVVIVVRRKGKGKRSQDEEF